MAVARTSAIAAAVFCATVLNSAVAQQPLVSEKEQGEEGASVGLDEVNRLVAAGKIRPLAEVVAVALRKCPGQLIDADLHRHDGRYIYEVEVLRQGQRSEIYLDAMTLAVSDRF